MEAVKSILFFWAKIVTGSIDRHTPDFAVSTIPRLGSASHCDTLQRKEAGEVTGKPKGVLPGQDTYVSRPFSYARGRVKILYPILYPSFFELT
jgi:hypothetical protein